MEPVVEFTKEENKILFALASQMVADPSSQKEAYLFCQQAKIASSYLTQRIRDVLNHFITHGSPTGYLLFRGIDLDNIEIPSTPPGNQYHLGEKTALAKIQSILVSAVSEMIAYEAEGYGRLFQDVVPIQQMAGEQTSLGSHQELEIHTEQAFSNLRPDLLSLACLRGDSAAFTYVLPVGKIVENLDSFDSALLKQPLWNTGVDLSFKLNGHAFLEGDIRGPFPILQYEGLNDSNGIEDIHLRFDQDLMKGVTEEADQMIGKIVDIYHRYKEKHCLLPGEIILIDNRRAVHGRSPFFPKYDGADRFLIRCFGSIDYDKSAYARPDGGRMIAAIFS